MSLKHSCDICGKTKDLEVQEWTVAKNAAGQPGGYVLSGAPFDWAVIQVLSPLSRVNRAKEAKEPRLSRYAITTPTGFIKVVCSVACAEKALDEAKEHLRSVFEEATHNE